MLVLVSLVVFPCLMNAREPAQNDDDIDLEEGIHVLRRSPCNGLQCRAAKDLEIAFHSMLVRDIPNTMVFGEANVERTDAEARHTLDNLPYKHRERVPIYCAWLTKIAQKDPDVSTKVTQNTREVIELAARLDATDSHCLPDVINALPHTPDMDKMIADQQETCTLEYPQHHCDEISRSASNP